MGAGAALGRLMRVRVRESLHMAQLTVCATHARGKGVRCLIIALCWMELDAAHIPYGCVARSHVACTVVVERYGIGMGGVPWMSASRALQLYSCTAQLYLSRLYSL